MKVYEGRLNAEGFKFALIVSRFNSLITERLLSGAVDCLERHGNAAADRELIRVPGTWEVPVAARWVVDAKSHDAVIALGCVIRGGTPHFDSATWKCNMPTITNHTQSKHQSPDAAFLLFRSVTLKEWPLGFVFGP